MLNDEKEEKYKKDKCDADPEAEYVTERIRHLFSPITEHDGSTR